MILCLSDQTNQFSKNQLGKDKIYTLCIDSIQNIIIPTTYQCFSLFWCYRYPIKARIETSYIVCKHYRVKLLNCKLKTLWSRNRGWVGRSGGRTQSPSCWELESWSPHPPPRLHRFSSRPFSRYSSLGTWPPLLTSGPNFSTLVLTSSGQSWASEPRILILLSVRCCTRACTILNTSWNTLLALIT